MKIKRLTKPIINPSPYPITCIGIINNSNGIILIFFFEKEPKIESKNKGNRQFMNLGASLKYNMFAIDFSYLASLNGRQSPLANTLRFTVRLYLDQAGATTE